MSQSRPLYYHLISSPFFFFSRIKELVVHPTFIVLTLLGNGFIVCAATVLYALESDVNPKLLTFVDALWWSVSTVTSVGYGDIVPVTTTGKFMGMITMIVGTAFFGSFTALFAASLLRPELKSDG